MSLHGFLVLDKAPGLSSQQAVAQLKRLMGTSKAGHTGTLDPLATGVLPVAFGEATKVIPYLDEALKVYAVEARLGEATDTYDREGQVTERGDPSKVELQFLNEALAAMTGPQLQTPPVFSAVKVSGKPAYRLARKGEMPELAPRTIVIEGIQLVSFTQPSFRFEVQCSKGTYVRSLVHDLGLRLGCFAHVTELRRLRSGAFELSQCLPGGSDLAAQDLKRALIPIEATLAHLAIFPLLDQEELLKTMRGMRLHRVQAELQKETLNKGIFTLAYEGRIAAVLEAGEGGHYDFKRVLNWE